MKKVLHFAFPDQEPEVEWRFIFCERFPSWRALGPHHGRVRGVKKDFAMLPVQKYWISNFQISPQAKRHKPSLIFTSFTILTSTSFQKTFILVIMVINDPGVIRSYGPSGTPVSSGSSGSSVSSITKVTPAKSSKGILDAHNGHFSKVNANNHSVSNIHHF